MKKIFNKKTLIYFLAFIIPILIIYTHIVSIEIINGNYIKNGENFLLADMYSQYNSIYAYIWDVLRGNASIFYSFGKSLGGNMASTVAYYAGSPLNLMYFFCKKIDIPIMTFILYTIKIGFSGLFMFIFLNHKIKENRSNLIFSIVYALMAYNVNFYFNSMWLDVVAITPLVITGIDKLILKRQILLYTISLSIAIISNFYISYMLCIFCLLYFIYQLFIEYKIREFHKYKYIIFRFVLCSLLACGLAMICLLPALFNLSEVIRFPVDKTILKVNINMWPKQFINNIFSKLYIGSHNASSILSRIRPNLYSSMLVIILTYLYFFNKKIKLKEKILSALVLFFYLLSFMLPHLNLFWQAGSFPNGYVCRYSFTFCFFIIFLAAKAFINLDKIKIKYLILFIIVYGLLSFKVWKQNLIFMNPNSIIISSTFVVIYLIFLLLIMYRNKKIFITLTIITVIIELFINFKLCFITNDDINVTSNYRKYYSKICSVINNYDSDTGFYRIDGDVQYNYLDSWICNNYGITSSLSTNSRRLYEFWKNNGGSITYTTINYDTNKLPIFDAITGVKYIKSNNKFEDTYYQLYDKLSIDLFSNQYIYENPYALSLGFTIPNDYESIYKRNKVKSSVDSLNRLMKTLSGNNENVLIKFKKEVIEENKFKFHINSNSDYIYLSFDYIPSINWKLYDNIYINDEYVGSSESYNVGSIKLKNKYKNSDIEVRVGNGTSSSNNDLEIYYFDLNAFKKDINKMKKNQLININVDSNKLTGDINVNTNSILFTSIPYEKGWKIYVDNKKTNYEKVVDEFIGIRLTKGKHKIKLIYYPPYLKIGALVTFVSIVIICIYLKFQIKK